MKNKVYVISDGLTILDREFCSSLAKIIGERLDVRAQRDIPVGHEESLAVVLVGEGVSQIVQAQHATKYNVPCIYFPTDVDAGTLHYKYGTETFFVTNSITGVVDCVRKVQNAYKKEKVAKKK